MENNPAMMRSYQICSFLRANALSGPRAQLHSSDWFLTVALQDEIDPLKQ